MELENRGSDHSRLCFMGIFVQHGHGLGRTCGDIIYRGARGLGVFGKDVLGCEVAPGADVGGGGMGQWVSSHVKDLELRRPEGFAVVTSKVKGVWSWGSTRRGFSAGQVEFKAVDPLVTLEPD